jgi:hypothetical protein
MAMAEGGVGVHSKHSANIQLPVILAVQLPSKGDADDRLS